MTCIHVKNLTRRFDDVVALNNCSFEFDSGIIHGIIGAEGAGKTTLLRILQGLLNYDSGEIAYLDDGVEFPISQIKEKVAYMPEKQSLYADLSVYEHLLFFKELYGIGHSDFKERSESLLHLTRLDKFSERAAGNLSGGMYKKLGLMCALLRSPSVILLDEPTNGVDPISRREFWDLLHDLTLKQKITVLMATAYMDEAERCSKVHLLEEGIVLEEGEPQDLIMKYGVSSFDELFLKKASEKK